MKYEKQKYEDPEKDGKDEPPTQGPPNSPGKIATMIQMMEDGEL